MFIIVAPFCPPYSQTSITRTPEHLAVLHMQLIDGNMDLNVYVIIETMASFCLLTSKGWEETVGENHTTSCTISVLLVKITQGSNNTSWIWCSCTVYGFM